MMLPVRMKTPSSTYFCPMVGANCRGGGTTDAMGRLKLGVDWVLVVTGEGVHGRAMHEEQDELSTLSELIDTRELQVLLELYELVLCALVPYLVQPPSYYSYAPSYIGSAS